jgi:hypothetical protein
MRSLVRVGGLVLFAVILIVLCAVQLLAVQRANITVKPPVAVRLLAPAGKPDLAIWEMKATLAYTEVGQEVTWKQRDRVRLEFTLKDIGLGPIANESFKVSIFQNGIHQDTWILPQIGVSGTYNYWDYFEYNHGEKTTYVIEINPTGTTPIEEGQALKNNRRTIVIGEGEETLLHANGTIYGVFTAVP